jgi:hypothetical protein
MWFSVVLPLLDAVVRKQYLVPYRQMEEQRPVLERLSLCEPMRISNIIAFLNQIVLVTQILSLTLADSTLSWPESVVRPIHAIALDFPGVDHMLLLTLW